MVPGPSFLITFNGSLVGGGGTSLTFSCIGAGLAAGLGCSGTFSAAGFGGGAFCSGAFVGSGVFVGVGGAWGVVG